MNDKQQAELLKHLTDAMRTQQGLDKYRYTDSNPDHPTTSIWDNSPDTIAEPAPEYKIIVDGLLCHQYDKYGNLQMWITFVHSSADRAADTDVQHIVINPKITEVYEQVKTLVQSVGKNTSIPVDVFVVVGESPDAIWFSVRDSIIKMLSVVKRV